MDATEINERTEVVVGKSWESVGPGTIARSLPGQTIRTPPPQKKKKNCSFYRRLQTIARYENK